MFKNWIDKIRIINLYRWIKESGTPPKPHHDVILMLDDDYELGCEVPIKLIGVFKRNDGDNKYVAVSTSRNTCGISKLNQRESEDLRRFYQHITEGECWFGAVVAVNMYLHLKKH